LPQGGLEIPCKYVFKTIKRIESEKARAVIEDALAIKIPAILQEDSTEDSVPEEIPPMLMKTQAPLSRSELYRKEPAETPTSTIFDKQVKSVSSSKGHFSVTLDCEVSCEPPSKLSDIEIKHIIMGEELNDTHINLAVRLLTTQFPDLSCLKSTLLQQMSPIPALEKKNKMLQIIHCSNRHHWIVATNIGSRTEGCVIVYDSTFKNVDSETRDVIDGMFQQLPIAKVKVAKSQKQKGKKDCGLFAIAYATALAYGCNLSKVKFCQESMRSHLVSCIEQDKLIPFP